jgi:hypothetical protein
MTIYSSRLYPNFIIFVYFSYFSLISWRQGNEIQDVLRMCSMPRGNPLSVISTSWETGNGNCRCDIHLTTSPLVHLLTIPRSFMSLACLLSIYRKSGSGVGFPSTCCFAPQSTLHAGFTIVFPSEVQATRGAAHTRSSRPQILHNSSKLSNIHTSHVLPVEDVRRQLIHNMFCSVYEHIIQRLADPTILCSGLAEDILSQQITTYSGLWSILHNAHFQQPKIFLNVITSTCGQIFGANLKYRTCEIKLNWCL